MATLKHDRKNLDFSGVTVMSGARRGRLSLLPWGEPNALLRHVSKPQPLFRFDGHLLPYFLHAYHGTYRNERCIEIPIALSLLRDATPFLEVGNVLNHYLTLPHDVVDKYESYPGVINQDVIDFSPSHKYEVVLCISTLEHVGWDETPKDPHKIHIALRRLQSLLKPKGRIIFTIPVGWNPQMDQKLFGHEIKLSQVWYMKRTGTMQWEQCGMEEIRSAKFGEPHWCANGLVIAEMVSEVCEGAQTE
jgi:hypothetical protein